jgi:hypothetical protein
LVEYTDFAWGGKTKEFPLRSIGGASDFDCESGGASVGSDVGDTSAIEDVDVGDVVDRDMVSIVD